MEYLVVAIVLLTGELIYFSLATRFDITDNPNRRSSHTKPTIRGGGIIFPISVICNAFITTTISWLWMVSLLTISLVSFLDDIFSLPNKFRIAIHLCAVTILFVDLHIFSLFSPAMILLVYILVIGSINAWNFMDGINGMTALYGFLVLLTLYYLNKRFFFTDSNLIVVTGIATIIFSFFNCRKRAICFAGDVGAVSIALILIYLLLSLIIVSGNVIFILLIVVYGVDSVMTICYRLFRKENIFEAHRSHLYQLLANEYKIPQLIVSFIYFILQMLVNILVIQTLFLSIKVQLIVGVLILIVLASAYWLTRYKLMGNVVANDLKADRK